MRVEVQGYKKSINETDFTDEQIKIIWDFYVTKSVAESVSQKRRISDYGKTQFPWKEMLKVAEVNPENCKILLANSINQSLINYDLDITEGKGDNKHNKAIEVGVPKIVCLTPFSIADEEPPKARVGEAESVLTHIRNAFAHSNTYFFDNNYVMFEDKDSRGAITARIIIKQQTILDWISTVDSEQKYYVLRNVGEGNA
ncbi:hypothetical protein [Ruminococcus sp. FC2018]|uniref:hypothetical protein n=1 Tax=Ruminococcus sp. FC2018 TaxID=1410617 RepID=UPI00048D712B|nr:hypothetical protein [Ruminococcus sp. FC2018]